MATPGIKSAIAGKKPEQLIAPLRAAPAGSAVLLDVDGTLAPIVAEPGMAAVPDGTRAVLIELKSRYGLLACVSGRRAEDARRVVGVDSLEYIGNHGLERLRAGAANAEVSAALDRYRDLIRAFATDAYSPELRQAGVALEDKDSIWSFHWRRSSDERSARGALERVAAAATSQGFSTHWGRKVLEVRPPLRFDKGSALASLLKEGRFVSALYAGDDVTDLDAFRELRELLRRGELEHVVCVGVRSDEGPAEVTEEADLIVEGPSGVEGLLEALL
jgi:trehalose 6-phosphate phosphatase